MDILDRELAVKKYRIENLPNHITRYAGTFKETTQQTYQIALTKFYNYLTDKHTELLSFANATIIVKEYKTYLEKSTKLGSKSIDTYIIIVQSFFNNYLNLEIKNIKRSNKRKHKGKIKYLEYDEVKGLINTVDKVTGNTEQIARDKAIICTLFGAGLRISELLNIEMKDFFKENNRYYINVIGKGNAFDELDTIALPNQTADYINKYLHEKRQHNRGCNYLFCSLTDKQLTRQSVNKNIKKIANTYDKLNDTNIAPRVSTHSFRHSFARYCLINKQIPINQVKDLLRHSNIETTAKYLENSQKEIQDIRVNIF